MEEEEEEQKDHRIPVWLVIRTSLLWECPVCKTVNEGEPKTNNGYVQCACDGVYTQTKFMGIKDQTRMVIKLFDS